MTTFYPEVATEQVQPVDEWQNHFAQLDLVAISRKVSEIIGHAPGTFEHESCLGRVLAELAMDMPATVRSDDRTRTYVLKRQAFTTGRAVA